MPGGVVATLPPGAGDGEGDASLQGPAQDDDKAQTDALPAQPKPAYSDDAANESAAGEVEAATGAVIALVGRIKQEDSAQAGAKTVAFVQTHPKPEKRKSARERAKEKYAKDGTTPDRTAKAKSKAEKAQKRADKKAKRTSAAKQA